MSGGRDGRKLTISLRFAKQAPGSSTGLDTRDDGIT